MKRKFTSLITLVIMFLVAIPVRSAFISTGIGNVVTAPQPGKYYFIQGNAQYDNIITWLREYNGALAGFRGDEPYYGEHSEEYIWTFEVTDEGYAAKNYKTGRYICIEGTSNGGKVTMQDTPSYFTIEVSGEEVAFKNASGQYIDMAYYGTDPVTWSGGVSGSRRLTIYEVVLEEIPDFTHALSLLEDCYEQHIPYTGGFFEIGTEAGQYNCAEDYDQFESSLFRAEAILSDPEKAQEEGVTAEVIYDLINLIETLYAKILASKVPLTIADGNYRIVSAMEWTNTRQIDTGEVDENGNPITQTVTTHPTKAMYATLEGNAMWANIDSTDCRYLWNLTNNTESGFIKMKNIATDGILNDCSKSSPATLTADSQTEMKFEVIERIDDKVVVAMKPSTRGGYGYLHCNGHSGGSGTASNIVGWEASAPASQWILEPVSDQEVAELVDAFAPIKDHEILVSRFQDLIAEAEATIEQAKDEQYISERAADGLITDTLQFSSPFSDPTEGSFANVLNDDANTFWHSTWQEGNKQNHDHFFQVSFQEPVSGYVQSFMRRRAAINDHITKLGVFGTNNENVVSQQIAEGEWTNLTEDGWTNLGSYDLSKNASSALTTYSNTLDFGEGYKYLRFYIDGTTTGRGYGHFATFQLYQITIDGNTQWSQMGDVAAALDTAFITAQSIDMDEVEMSDYEALKQALDAFKAALVDPSALAAAINDIKDINQLIAIGDAPGFWKQDSNFGELSNTLQAAIAYLKGGAYTQEQVDAYTQALTTGKKDLFASANPVEEGKWYAIRFDTQEKRE